MINKLGGFFLLTAFLSCNSPEQNSAVGNSEDSVTINTDSPPGDTRGNKGTGVDNSGGTPGPGTLTDTFKGKTDTSDHTTRKVPSKK